MRVVHLIPTLTMGGAERFCLDIASISQRRGHEVIIVVVYNQISEFFAQELKEKNIRVIFLNKQGTLLDDIFVCLRLGLHLKKIKPDVIHTHLYALRFLLPLMIFFEARIIHTVQTIAKQDVTDKLGVLLNKLFYKLKMVKVIAISQNVARSVQEMYGIYPPIIYNFLDTARIEQIEKKKKDQNHLKFISVARFVSVKNHHLLIKAFARFVTSYKQAGLYLIGGGELWQEIADLIKELKLENKVFLLGKVPSIYQALSEADCFVMTSLWEGFPISILEAFYMGLPVLSTPIAGIEEVIKDGENGFIAIDFSEDAFYALLKRFSEISADEVVQLKINAKSCFEDKFSEKAFDQYLEFYNA